MRKKTFALILFATLMISTATQNLAFFFKNHQMVYINKNTKKIIKLYGIILAGSTFPIITDSYFEYQDDKIISKMKETSSEYQNATSYKEKAKISKAILTEYYSNFSFKKKWGRRCIRAISVLGYLGLTFFYIKRILHETL